MNQKETEPSAYWNTLHCVEPTRNDKNGSIKYSSATWSMHKTVIYDE